MDSNARLWAWHGRRWLMSLFAAVRPRATAEEAAADGTEQIDRLALLAGRPLRKAANAGPLICSCMGVGRQAIVEAIRAHGLSGPREVGARLGAGTRCGSCVPEIRALIAEAER
ncbi:MAG: (2Fe-2S)-binding protein [Steroidobacteraceae bacterium]